VAQLKEDGVAHTGVETSYYADMAYIGQVHRLRVAVDPGWGADDLNKAFLAAYEVEFGTTLGNVPVLIVNVRTTVRGVRQGALTEVSTPGDRPVAEPRSKRPVFFNGAWHDTAIYSRYDLLPGMRFTGPAVVEQPDTTTVVEPGMAVWIDGRANMQIEVNND
jgi:N-methylhydantoinase A